MRYCFLFLLIFILFDEKLDKTAEILNAVSISCLKIPISYIETIGIIVQVHNLSNVALLRQGEARGWRMEIEMDRWLDLQYHDCQVISPPPPRPSSSILHFLLPPPFSIADPKPINESQSAISLSSFPLQLCRYIQTHTMFQVGWGV